MASRAAWDDGAGYERYVGRWSRLVAGELVAWLGAPPGGRWLDVGCGTGALAATILETAEPAALLGVDPAPAQVAEARLRVSDRRAEFDVAAAEALPAEDGRFDEDYWEPFLGGVGPAPAYAMSLEADRRARLRERLRADLPTEADGSIRLTARAWAVRGRA
jgi:SAM-dependent methyltransferase